MYVVEVAGRMYCTVPTVSGLKVEREKGQTCSIQRGAGGEEEEWILYIQGKQDKQGR